MSASMKRYPPLVMLCVSILLVLSDAPKARAKNIDERVYDLVHDTYRSSALDRIMKSCTRIGDRHVILGADLILATYGREYERDTAKLICTSLIGSQLVASGLKLIVNRRRPEGDHSRSNSSFPSGHATGAFAVATILAHRYEGHKILFYIVASSIAISRVYLGRHFPSDVVVGAFLGYMGSKGTLRVQKKILTLEL